MLLLFTIGLALSMDTFSLALSLGTLNLNKKNILLFTTLVGLLHFMLPLLSRRVGTYIFFINPDKLLGIIFLFIFLKLTFELRKEEKTELNINFISLFILAISVSLDSFSTGLGLAKISSSIFLPSLIFLLESSFFTLLGLLIGKNANQSLGKVANYFGLFLLLMLSIIHLVK